MNGSTFKSFEPYNMITNKNSRQYQFLFVSGNVIPCDDGLFRTLDGYIAVALSPRYGQIGDKFIIKLSTNKEVKVVLGDVKSSKDTTNNCFHPDGSLVELIVDRAKIKENYPEADIMGDFNYSDFFNGEIIGIEKVVR